MYKLTFLILVASWIENVLTDPSTAYSSAYASANARGSASALASSEANANAVSHQPPQQENPRYAGRVKSECFNNPCVRKYCDEAEPAPDCKFEGTCTAGDVCKEGYLIARDDRCVPADQCTNPITCSDDKVFSFCINGGCGRVNCTQLRQPLLCIDFATGGCDPGCVCKDNKLLTKNGTCVPANECPGNEVCPNPHETFDPCPSTCPSQYCPDLFTSSECSPQSTPECQPGCRCDEGYYKTLNEDCVPLKDCRYGKRLYSRRFIQDRWNHGGDWSRMKAHDEGPRSGSKLVGQYQINRPE